MRKSTIVTIIVVIIIIFLGVYAFAKRGNNNTNQNTNPPATNDTGTSANSSTDNSNSTSTDNTTPPPPTSSAVLATSSNATLGNFLTATNGMTLYRYTNDTPGVSNCSGTCATNWPPYTVTAASSLTAAADITGKLGTITRADGTAQLTYDNQPLYFWHGDTKAGDTNGQNVGGVWFVVQP
ncbi:MAG TPA: hypothetical protein VFX17_03820 [Patescibacteria group bacterium]|nr:hypothetical protein [Patescibacteria group bacterium]